MLSFDTNESILYIYINMYMNQTTNTLRDMEYTGYT